MINLLTKCPYCKEDIKAEAVKCKHCGEWLNINIRQDSSTDEDFIVNKIADCEKASTILWLIVAIIQICSIVCIVAGIWNLVAVINRWKLPSLIKEKNACIPACYESMVGLIVLCVVNLLIGGILGVLLTAFDFYIRSLVLENRRLFTNEYYAT